jgi:hypothetical protein
MSTIIERVYEILEEPFHFSFLKNNSKWYGNRFFIGDYPPAVPQIWAQLTGSATNKARNTMYIKFKN